MKNNLIFRTAVLSFFLIGSGCSQSNPVQAGAPAINSTTKNSNSDITVQDPDNPKDDSAQVQDAGSAQILLFNGIGTSFSDWKSLEQIINSAGLTYRLINTSTLNSMSLTTLKTYKLILIPGGNSNDIIKALTLSTEIRVRKPVRDGGVSFLGLCAGAFAEDRKFKDHI